MTTEGLGYAYQKLCINYASLKHACPKGVYVAPIPNEPLRWTGVVFPQKGPYATAVLRFQIEFPAGFPARPPVIKFLCDVFHPLVTPWTTYTHTIRHGGADTVSSADGDRLPPGGLTLRHGFPEWDEVRSSPEQWTASPEQLPCAHVVEILQYLRVAFDSEQVIDSVPLELAANTGAWHAWRSYRAKVAPAVQLSTDARINGATTAHQPGGARRPGQWNWQGVWQDRVKKSISSSKSDHALFTDDDHSVIKFQKWEEQDV